MNMSGIKEAYVLDWANKYCTENNTSTRIDLDPEEIVRKAWSLA